MELQDSADSILQSLSGVSTAAEALALFGGRAAVVAGAVGSGGTVAVALGGAALVSTMLLYFLDDKSDGDIESVKSALNDLRRRSASLDKRTAQVTGKMHSLRTRGPDSWDKQFLSCGNLSAEIEKSRAELDSMTASLDKAAAAAVKLARAATMCERVFAEMQKTRDRDKKALEKGLQEARNLERKYKR